MKKSTFSLFLISLFAFFNVGGQNTNLEELEKHIDALVPESITASTPGLVVGVAHKGEVIFSKGYGMANLSYKIPNDPKMVYNIGSVAKQFLGYAFAMLQVEGKLNIDDPVSKYLEDWPEFDQKVSLRNLLTHTSGYREAYTMSNLAGRETGVDRLSRESCLEVVRRQPALEFTPGSRYTYNSTAWVILAEVFEKVAGKSAEEWVEENILQPLGMNDTQIESYVGEVIINAAESYSQNGENQYTNPKSNRAIFGAADINTSIHDLAKWVDNFRTAKVGGKAVQDLFFDPFILNDGSNSEYALGIGVSTYRGLKRYRHTGGHEAFVTQSSYFPEHDLAILTVSNFGGRGWISTAEIADFILGDFMESEEEVAIEGIDLKKKDLEKFTGVYISSIGNDHFNLTLHGDTLKVDERRPLIPTAPNSFRVEGWSARVEIETTTDNKLELAIIGDSKDIYHKGEDWAPTSKDFSLYLGDYWSEELETVYHLQVVDKNLVINHRWLGEISLSPIAKDHFRSNWGFYVIFQRDAQKKITGFNINSGRTLNVFFQLKE